MKVAERAYSAQARYFDIEAVYQTIDSVSRRRKINGQIADMQRLQTFARVVVGFDELSHKGAPGHGSAYLVT